MGPSVAKIQIVHPSAVKTRRVLRNIRAELRAKLAIHAAIMSNVLLYVATIMFATMKTLARTVLSGGSFCWSTFCCPLLLSVQ